MLCGVVCGVVLMMRCFMFIGIVEFWSKGTGVALPQVGYGKVSRGTEAQHAVRLSVCCNQRNVNREAPFNKSSMFMS